MSQVIFLSIKFYQETPPLILYAKKIKIMVPWVTGVYR